ncbi:caspase-8 [Betta splendens]|uniref:Caspase-8 n=1 Tax=Betta splendens TaxID=158456 RepID=A0A6P7KWV8_BETSP|nr:caspase-8 [Betta splendens]XP_028986886.1 caspase-8 [Betta splendens]
MNRIKLSRIDEELGSSEVAELCFLCRDVISKKRLEGVRDAKDLFSRLEERGLLNAFFLCDLLKTICRADLLQYLQTDNMPPEQTDASPCLSAYRVMLYGVYNDLTQENFQKMKYLFEEELGKRNTEMCNTALDLFAELEKTNNLSDKNLNKLLLVLKDLDQQLASNVQCYIDLNRQKDIRIVPRGCINDQVFSPSLPVSETQPSYGGSVCSDAEPAGEPCRIRTLSDEYYALEHNPRGLCVVINNENFWGPNLKERKGTQQDKEALCLLFSDLGFTPVVHNDLTADDIRLAIKKLGTENFSDHDALVVCVLSHGENGCVYGIDEQEVYLRELTLPFTSTRAPTLAGKPKLFFIQACQGRGYQVGSMPCFEDDAGRVPIQTVPADADFLMGMATLPEYKSFRHTSTGSIYIQELCKQLRNSADRSENDDILTVLTRVNREVSRGDYLRYKQMPEPKYTLTKKLVLRYVK